MVDAKEVCEFRRSSPFLLKCRDLRWAADAVLGTQRDYGWAERKRTPPIATCGRHGGRSGRGFGIAGVVVVVDPLLAPAVITILGVEDVVDQFDRSLVVLQGALSVTRLPHDNAETHIIHHFDE